MNKDKQRIAIAEELGFEVLKPSFSSFMYRKKGVTDWILMSDYLNDLNAMHEAEEVLNEDQGCNYHDQLETICQAALMKDGIETSHWLCFKTTHATAAQRAEAFLRTIGKWEESE